MTLGYHRMFTHRAFEASRAFRAVMAVLGSMAVEGSVITWVADHRKHHAFTDKEGDPHSPHLSGPGFSGRIKGLWHAHVGWLFETVGTAERERFAPDLVKDRVLRGGRQAVLGVGRARLRDPLRARLDRRRRHSAPRSRRCCGAASCAYSSCTT